MKFLSVLSFAVATTLALSAQAAVHPMEEVKNAVQDSYVSYKLPKGFTDEKLHRRPKLEKSFVAYLAKLEESRANMWKKHVLENEDEFGELSREKREDIAANPTRELGIQYLVQIDEVYKIYQGKKHVGFVYRTNDHVRASIINDGSGVELYLDVNQKVIGQTKWDQ